MDIIDISDIIIKAIIKTAACGKKIADQEEKKTDQEKKKRIICGRSDIIDIVDKIDIIDIIIILVFRV
jgi:hypothetical protein